jgi:hypothetical protein
MTCARGRSTTTNPERFLDVPEPVVGADHELRCLVGDVGGVTLDPGQVAGLASSTRFTDLSAPVITMNRLRFTGTFPATAFSALAICSSMPPQRAAGPVGLVLVVDDLVAAFVGRTGGPRR